MRIRVRGPNGVETVSIDASATVDELKKAITESTGLPDFDIKTGYPPQVLDLSQFNESLKLGDTGLKLDGEQCICIARDVAQKMQQSMQGSTPNPAPRVPTTIKPTSQTAVGPSEPSKPLALTRKPNDVESDPPEVPLPLLGGSLVLRVMPDDNSCLFRALGACLLGTSLDSMHELRSIVAQGIQSQPDLYNEATLEKSPDAYCKWIQNPDSWGGGIEMGILAQQFDVEVCSINVQDLRVDRFNEGKAQRCILVYSGIHYDAIALSYGSPDFDVKQFDASNEDIVEKARDLCRILQSRHYYTDTAGFELKCNTCGGSGSGEKWATQHAAETGHYDFGEAQ